MVFTPYPNLGKYAPVTIAASASASAAAAASSATSAASSATSAAASAQTAHDISNISTSDGVVTNLVNDTTPSQTRAALDGAYVQDAAKGQPGGVAPLDANSLLPEANVPARLTEASLDGAFVPFTFSKAFATPYNGVEPVQSIELTSKNTGTVSQRRAAYHARASDAASVNQVDVTDATNAAPIVVTATAHGYATGDRVTVEGVTGNTAANGIWDITVLTADTFSLNTSTGNGAFVAGGFVTNRSMMTGLVVEVGVAVDRGGLTGTRANGDDADGVTVANIGAAKGTDAFYVAGQAGVTGWSTSFSSDDNSLIGFRAGGTYTTAAAEFCGPVLIGAPSGGFGAGDVRLRRTAAAELTIDDGSAGAITAKITGSLQLPNNPTTGTDSNFLLSFNTLGLRRVRVGDADSAGTGFRALSVSN